MLSAYGLGLGPHLSPYNLTVVSLETGKNHAILACSAHWRPHSVLPEPGSNQVPAPILSPPSCGLYSGPGDNQYPLTVFLRVGSRILLHRHVARHRLEEAQDLRNPRQVVQARSSSWLEGGREVKARERLDEARLS